MPLFGISQAEFVIKFVFRCSRKQYQNKKKKIRLTTNNQQISYNENPFRVAFPLKGVSFKRVFVFLHSLIHFVILML